jgi:FkbM family methyltransferase
LTARRASSAVWLSLSRLTLRAHNLFYLLGTEDGWRLRRSGVDARKALALRRLHETYGQGSATTVVDVGAHHGAYVRLFAAAFPEAVVHAFEPVASSFAQLQRGTAPLGRRVRTHCMALSRDTSAVALGINNFSAASSAYQPTRLHTEAFPSTATVEASQVVAATTLDAWADVAEVDGIDLLKLDVQGAEADVLAGGDATLQRTRLILCELSVAPLYEGAPLLPAMVEAMTTRGFAWVDVFDELRDPRDGRLLQLDAVFVRS